MSQSQLMSTAMPMAGELLESVGFEVTIFAITLAVALVFRGLPLAKTNHSFQKACSTPNAKVKQLGTGCSAKAWNTNPAKHVPSQKLASADGLSQEVESMIDCANRRQSANAVAIYERLRKNGKLAAIEDAMKSAKYSRVDVFNLLVQCAGRLGRPDLIELLLDDMTHAGIDRSLAFYESTMKMLASKKCYKEAISVCGRLEADGLEPSPVTLSCLITFAVEVGEPHRAIDFFNRLAAASTPSIRAYMTILRVYSRRQDWPKSLALIRSMKQLQAPIDSLVLNVVLATGVAAGQLDAAQALLNEFSNINITDVVSYNTVMKGFAQQKEGGRAIRLLDEMYQAGTNPNIITFNTAMDAAVRSSRIADAWNVLARMRDAGLAPDKVSCTTLMKGIQNGATAEQLTMILDLLRNVTKECDSALCGFLFRSVIEAAAQVNDADLTARVVGQMREKRQMLSAYDYQRLMQILVRDEGTKRWNEPAGAF